MLFDIFSEVEKLYSCVYNNTTTNGCNIDLHNKQNIKVFKQQQEYLKKELNYDESIQIGGDSRRQVSKYEKEEIWGNSRTHNNFDAKYFRKDILGNVCVKNLCLYRSFSKRNEISYQYEHIKSYYNGGKTNTENVCLLNSGINNMKRCEEIFTIDYMKAFGYCKFHGISFEDLEYELNNNIHLVCDKYNIYFYKEQSQWTVKKYSYNHEYLDKHKDKENGKYIGEKIIDGKNLLYDNKEIIVFTAGIAGCIFIGYWLGNRSLQRKMYEAYKIKKEKVKNLNNNLKLLKYEIEEINDEKIYKQKKLLIDDIKEELYILETKIDKLAKELNI